MFERSNGFPLPRAFTLIEIMVVVLVIGVLSTLAIPQFTGSFRRAALSSATDDLVTTLRYLQRRAVVTQRTYRLVIEPSQDSDSPDATTCRAQAAAVALDEPEDWLPLDGGPIKPMTLPRDVRVLDLLMDVEPLEGDPPAIAFYADGSADAAILQLTNDDMTTSIVVEPTSGRVYRADGEVTQLPSLREDLDV